MEDEKIKNPMEIHFYFTKETSDFALEIREELKKKFPTLTFYNPHFENIGPHLYPMWEADFSKSKEFHKDFGSITHWLMLNRKGHSVLIHPHTGNSLKDHTINAIWLGEKLNLNFKELEE